MSCHSRIQPLSHAVSQTEKKQPKTLVSAPKSKAYSFSRKKVLYEKLHPKLKKSWCYNIPLSKVSPESLFSTKVTKRINERLSWQENRAGHNFIHLAKYAPTKFSISSFSSTTIYSVFYFDFNAYIQKIPENSLVEKQESFVRCFMLRNTFWLILDDSY